MITAAIAVPSLVGVVLGLWAAYWTVRNAKAREIRETGPRPSLKAAIAMEPDLSLKERRERLRREAYRRAAA